MKELNLTVTALLIAMLLLVYPVSAVPLTVYDIPVTRDLTDTPLPTRAEHLAVFPETALHIASIERPAPFRDENGTIVLVVNTGLFEALEEAFNAWITDLSDEEYAVVAISLEGGSPQELKDLVIEEGGEELSGVIFAGELPLAFYEHREFFYDEENGDGQRIVEYPIDMFFTDIDGEWEDTSGNGVYDHHYGAVDPDIWLGRLPAHNLSRIEEHPFVETYLERIHRYRSGELNLPHRALNYIDDDWASLDRTWTSDMGHMFGGIVSESHPDTTSATGYAWHLESEGYDLVQVAVHSTSDSHSFFVEGRSRRDYFRFFHLRDDVDCNVLFYNLFACSVMNMSGDRHLCMGVLYAMGEPASLGAVGSTKTGSMLFFDDYYRPLAEGANFGEALKLWMTEHAHDQERPNWARSWFYGMTHYGDPTLKLRQGLRITATTLDDSRGDDDSILDAGEQVELAFTITNRGEIQLADVDAILLVDDPRIEIIEESTHFESIDPGEEIPVSGFAIRVAEDFIDNTEINLRLIMSPANDEPWWEGAPLRVRAPLLETVWAGFSEIDGDGDGWTEAGESGVISVHFRNSGGDRMPSDGRIYFESLDGWFSMESEFAVLPAAGTDSVTFSSREAFSISPEAGDAGAAFIEVSGYINDIVRGSGIITLPLRSDFQFQDVFEREPAWFRHYAVSNGFTDVWSWGELYGENSGGIAFTGADSTEYPPNSDAVVETPLLMFGNDAVLEIRHRVDVEPEWDACVVEIDRGDGWRRVEPEGGYPGTSVENGSYSGGPCWNGTLDWMDSRIHLGDRSGALRIRFRFSSDAAVEGEGWFIDRVIVTGTVLEVAEIAPEPRGFSLSGVYPNPFNDVVQIHYTLPEAGEVQLTVYDVSGRMIEQLVSQHQEAGRFRTAWQSKVNPTGMYFLRLKAAGQVRLYKVVLVK